MTPEESRAYHKAYYKANREKLHGSHREVNAKGRERNREYVNEHKKKHPCVDCGMTDIRCLDFDHLGDKKSNISVMVHTSRALSVIKAEIEKCEVRCSNCHRIKTWERRQQEV